MVIPQTDIIVSQDGTEIGRHTFTPGEYIIGREAKCGILIGIGVGIGVSPFGLIF